MLKAKGKYVTISKEKSILKGDTDETATAVSQNYDIP